MEREKDRERTVTSARALAIAASCCMRCFSAAVGPVPMLDDDVGPWRGASSVVKSVTFAEDEELSSFEEDENQPMLCVCMYAERRWW